MRYVRLLFLHLQQLTEQKSRSLVWFLVALINPLYMIFFWRGGINSNNQILGWSFSSFVSYYILLMIAGSLIMSHVENEVSRDDIQQGNLVSYLTKPFPYLWLRFYSELPWRVLQGLYGGIILLVLLLFIPNLIAIKLSFTLFSLALVMWIIAHLMAFYFKMIMGALAFWFIDTNGLYQAIDLIIIVLAGFLVPLPFLPTYLNSLAYILPFSYMIYFPISTLLGKFSIQESLSILFIQIIWLAILYLTYKFVWGKGLKVFTGVGQ